MNLPDLPMIWRAGCIIRAVFLEEITKAFKADPNLAEPADRRQVPRRDHQHARTPGGASSASACSNGIATPAFSASLAYYDSYRRGRLPGNLIQAQRDFFGGHTYSRTDKPGDQVGPYHMEWSEGGKETLVREGMARTK